MSTCDGITPHNTIDLAKGGIEFRGLRVLNGQRKLELWRTLSGGCCILSYIYIQRILRIVNVSCSF